MNSLAIVENNMFEKNSASMCGVFDFNFLMGISYFVENIFLNNFAYSLAGNKVGSGGVGSLRGTHQNINFLIFEKYIMNWAEAQGVYYSKKLE